MSLKYNKKWWFFW